MKYLILFALITCTVIIGCDSPMEVNRPGDKLSGYITQLDTNIMVSSTGFYSISIYSADSSNPFHRVPARSDSLSLTRRSDGFCYETLYNMTGVPDGKYFVAVTWSRYPRVANEKPKVLGTYGCDTLYGCSNHKIVTYPNFDGNFRNITSWTDTTRFLY